MIEEEDLNYSDEGYQGLSNAIILQAVHDLRRGCRRNGLAAEGGELKRFFYSQWFRELTGVDGPTLYKRVLSEAIEKRKKDIALLSWIRGGIMRKNVVITDRTKEESQAFIDGFNACLEFLGEESPAYSVLKKISRAHVKQFGGKEDGTKNKTM